MRPCVNTYTQLGHTCTHLCPLGPIILTHSLQGHTSSHTCPHGNGGGQKRAGWGRAEEGAALPQAVWQKLTQASSLLMLRPPPGPLALAAGALSTYGGSAHYMPGTVLRALRALAHCLLLTPTCEKGSY